MDLLCENNSLVLAVNPEVYIVTWEILITFLSYQYIYIYILPIYIYTHLGICISLMCQIELWWYSKNVQKGCWIKLKVKLCSCLKNFAHGNQRYILLSISLTQAPHDAINISNSSHNVRQNSMSFATFQKKKKIQTVVKFWDKGDNGVWQ